MSVTNLVQRTIYVALCPQCGSKDVRVDNPPRETRCACGTWVPFTEESYIGPDQFAAHWPKA